MHTPNAFSSTGSSFNSRPSASTSNTTQQRSLETYSQQIQFLKMIQSHILAFESTRDPSTLRSLTIQSRRMMKEAVLHRQRLEIAAQTQFVPFSQDLQGSAGQTSTKDERSTEGWPECQQTDVGRDKEDEGSQKIYALTKKITETEEQVARMENQNRLNGDRIQHVPFYRQWIRMKKEAEKAHKYRLKLTEQLHLKRQKIANLKAGDNKGAPSQGSPKPESNIRGSTEQIPISSMREGDFFGGGQQMVGRTADNYGLSGIVQTRNRTSYSPSSG